MSKLSMGVAAGSARRPRGIPAEPPPAETRELELIAGGARMLAEAKGLFEVRDVRSVAIAAASYARARDLGDDAVRSASEIVVLATARLGEEIALGQKRGEIARPGVAPGRKGDVRAADITPATLEEIGVDRHVASAGQRLAAQPDAVREYLAAPGIPTVAGALRAATEALADAVLPAAERTVDPALEASARIYRAMRLPSVDSWPAGFDVRLLDDKAIVSVRGAQDSWRRWIEQWDAALAEAPHLRSVK